MNLTTLNLVTVYSNSSVMNLTTLNLVTVYSNSSVMNLTTLNLVTVYSNSSVMNLTTLNLVSKVNLTVYSNSYESYKFEFGFNDEVFTNTTDPEQAASEDKSDLGLHCLLHFCANFKVNATRENTLIRI